MTAAVQATIVATPGNGVWVRCDPKQREDGPRTGIFAHLTIDKLRLLDRLEGVELGKLFFPFAVDIHAAVRA